MIIHYTKDYFSDNSYIETACGTTLSPGVRRWNKGLKITNDRTQVACKNCLNKLKEKEVVK